MTLYKVEYIIKNIKEVVGIHKREGRMRMVGTERFDVLSVDLSDAKGSEQGKVRPCVVVGNDLNCKYSPVILVMPFTCNIYKKSIPTHKIIEKEEGSGLKVDSLLLGEQPTPIDRSRIIKKLGRISGEENKRKIDEACYEAFFYKKNVGGTKN